MIPVIMDGVVARVIDDFLGKTIFVRHGLHEQTIRRLYTIYAHVEPRPDIKQGAEVAAGGILGEISPGKRTVSACPPHLHLSVALIDDQVRSGELNWQFIGASEWVELLDPLAFFPPEQVTVEGPVGSGE
ncbi:peptidoglycan DD-metalloendopeptidase family protein [Thermodesulfobacteriota bacterium]